MIPWSWPTTSSWSNAHGTDQKRVFTRVMFGITVSLCGLFLVVYAIRTAIAQFDYSRLKYGDWVSESRLFKQSVAERSYNAYPANYYLCQMVSQDLWDQSHTTRWGTRETLLKDSREWCDRGRQLNPYDRQLAWIDANLALTDSADAALAIWQPYVDRVFWDPWNLLELVRFRVAAGQLDRARDLLPLLSGKPGHTEAVALITRAAERY